MGLRDKTHASRGWVYGVKTVGGDDISTDISIEWDTKKHGIVIEGNTGFYECDTVSDEGYTYQMNESSRG